MPHCVCCHHPLKLSMCVKRSVCQGWVVDCAPAALQKGPNGGVVSTPLMIKLLFLASPSRHLNSNRKGGCVCEEWTLRCSQTEQAQLGLSCKASKYSDAGTGDLGVLTTHEISSMNIATRRTTHLATMSREATILLLPVQRDKCQSCKLNHFCAGKTIPM